MSRYDPNLRGSRMELAEALLALFERSLFEEIRIEGTKERVFARTVPNTEGRVRVAIYSTIVGNECRRSGKDAIRVCTLYRGRDGRDRGIGSEKRVNRTGTLQAIADRVIDRMRGNWKAVKGIERCHCGAPKFVSKVRTDRRTGHKTGGSHVCADFCWKTNSHAYGDHLDSYNQRNYQRGW